MLLDSSAWINLFEGSDFAKEISQLIKSQQVYTSCLTIAEVSKWCFKNDANEEDFLKVIEENSIILNLKRDILINAGKILTIHRSKYNKFGMIDALIYSTAFINNLTILTADRDFEGLEGVQILGKNRHKR